MSLDVLARYLLLLPEARLQMYNKTPEDINTLVQGIQRDALLQTKAIILILFGKHNNKLVYVCYSEIKMLQMLRCKNVPLFDGTKKSTNFVLM